MPARPKPLPDADDPGDAEAEDAEVVTEDAGDPDDVDDDGADDDDDAAEAAEEARDERLRLGWKACRYGVQSARTDAKVLARVLDALAKLDPRPPKAVAGAWRAILNRRDVEASLDLISNPDFFDLLDERQDFWRPLVLHHPFAPLIPGRTPRDRQAFLARLK